MSNVKDSRRDPRAKVLSMTVRYKSATVADFVENHSHDVSRGGIFIKSPSPFPPGTLLKFEVRLAQEQRVMMGVGRVAWKREKDLSEEKPAGMGVKFIKLNTESAALIEQLLDGRADASSTFERGSRELGVRLSRPPSLRPPSIPPASSAEATRTTAQVVAPPATQVPPLKGYQEDSKTLIGLQASSLEIVDAPAPPSFDLDPKTLIGVQPASLSEPPVGGATSTPPTSDSLTDDALEAGADEPDAAGDASPEDHDPSTDAEAPDDDDTEASFPSLPPADADARVTLPTGLPAAAANADSSSSARGQKSKKRNKRQAKKRKPKYNTAIPTPKSASLGGTEITARTTAAASTVPVPRPEMGTLATTPPKKKDRGAAEKGSSKGPMIAAALVAAGLAFLLVRANMSESSEPVAVPASPPQSAPAATPAKTTPPPTPSTAAVPTQQAANAHEETSARAAEDTAAPQGLADSKTAVADSEAAASLEAADQEEATESDKGLSEEELQKLEQRRARARYARWLARKEAADRAKSEAEAAQAVANGVPTAGDGVKPVPAPSAPPLATTNVPDKPAPSSTAAPTPAPTTAPSASAPAPAPAAPDPVAPAAPPPVAPTPPPVAPAPVAPAPSAGG